MKYSRYQNQKIYNQRGVTAIMFAMVFIMIISLLSVGYASIVRIDQRATLDKTLSAEAQLAAETGANSAVQHIDAKIKADPLNADNAELLNKTACATGGLGYTKPALNNGVQLTCVTWDLDPEDLAFSLAPYESYSFNVEGETNYSKISWRPQANKAAQGYTYDPAANNQLPALQEDSLSIVKLVTVSKKEIYNVDKRGLQVVYLVPVKQGLANVQPARVVPSGGCAPTKYVNFIDLGDGCIGTQPDNLRRADGLVYFVPCDGSGVCNATIAGYDNQGSLDTGGDVLNNKMFYFMPMGTESTNFTFESYTGADVRNPIKNVQAKIDVNAQAQDQSKRLIVRHALTQNGNDKAWKPSFAAMADSLCKDIKVDATNNYPAPGSTGDVCPNN